MACKDLVPFVLGEIDIGGDDLGIRLRGLRAARSRLDFRHDDLEIIQRIQLLRRTNLLASTARLVALVVEAVASALELARSHPSIRTLGDKGSPCVSELPAHAPQVEAVLGTWRPAEQAPVGPLIGIRVVGPSDITYTHTIAVQAGDDTPVGITRVYVILRHMEVTSDDRRKGVIRLPVGSVRSAVRECSKLSTGKRIAQKRGVVPLYGKPNPAFILKKTGLHTVAPERILELR